MNTLATLHISTSQSWLTISALLVGVLTPAVVAIINHPVWEPQAKRIIAVASAAILGILTVIANGIFTDFEVNIANVVTVILAIIGAAQASYALFWKPTGAADAIENGINPGPPLIVVNPPLTTDGHVSDPLTPPEIELTGRPQPLPGTVTADGSTVVPEDYNGDDGGFPDEPVQQEPAVPPEERL